LQLYNTNLTACFPRQPG